MTSPRLAFALCASLLASALAGCAGQPAAVAPTAPAPTAITAAANSAADLSGIKQYLVGKGADLQAATAAIQSSANRYYELARAANFDYAALWGSQRADTQQALEQARAAWLIASPLYEQMEGIVAGVPTLAQFDVDLDAGSSAAEGGDNLVSFDLALPNGTTLAKPGNLFGVTESALWGTYADFTAKNAPADFDGDGAIEFGEALPEANVLKASADLLASKSAELAAAAQQWQPSEADAFTALVVMVPTMTEYFDSWKNSRFVAGEASQQRDFVAISRLSDIQNILGSLQVVHQGISPLITKIDPAQDQQIGQQLNDLKAFVANVHTQEQSGKRFKAEEADLLGAEAQNRATAITGQVTQVAAKLNITIEQ